MDEQGIEAIEALKDQAMDCVNAGDARKAAEAFAKVVEREPDQPDNWINLATTERALGMLRLSEEHYLRGIDLLRQAGTQDRGLLCSALHALGGAYEALELTDKAASAYRESAALDPRAPTPLAALAQLLARAGHLDQAERVATEYCLAAVSILAEKGNIATVRQFQKALKQAQTIDGNLVLVATREAYARGFAETAAKLPKGARLELEPHRHDEAGKTVPVLPNPARPFARVRFDAIDPATGERWMIQDSPTYGFPSPAAAEGAFSIPHPARTPFPVLIATHTAWDYFFLRLRFANGLGPDTIARAEKHLGAWYLKGFEGGFGEGGRGFFHFVSEPFPIGADGLRYEIDLGLSQLDAIPALFEALTALHQEEPIAVAVLGDGALPIG